MKSKVVQILMVSVVFLSAFLLKDFSLSVDKIYASCPMSGMGAADCPDHAGSAAVTAPEVEHEHDAVVPSAEGAGIEKLVRKFDSDRKSYERKKATLVAQIKERKTNVGKKERYIEMRKLINKETQGLISQIEAILALGESNADDVEKYEDQLNKAKELLTRDLDSIDKINARIQELKDDSEDVTIEDAVILVDSVDTLNKHYTNPCGEFEESGSDAEVTEKSGHDHDGDAAGTDSDDEAEKARERDARRYFSDRSMQELEKYLDREFGNEKVFDPALGERAPGKAKEIRQALKDFALESAAEYFVEKAVNPDIRKSRFYYDSDSQSKHNKEEVNRVKREYEAKQHELSELPKTDKDHKKVLEKELFALEVKGRSLKLLAQAFDDVRKNANVPDPGRKPVQDWYPNGDDTVPPAPNSDWMQAAMMLGGPNNLSEEDKAMLNQIFGTPQNAPSQSSDPRLHIGGGVSTNPWGGMDISLLFGDKHRGFKIGGSFDNNYYKNNPFMMGLGGMQTPGYNPLQTGFIDGPNGGSFGMPFNPGNAYADPRSWVRR